jgi:hypothetical protein
MAEGSSRRLLARCLFPFIRIKQGFANPDVLGRNLDHFIVIDIGNGLFQCHHLGRGQADGVGIAGIDGRFAEGFGGGNPARTPCFSRRLPALGCARLPALLWTQQRLPAPQTGAGIAMLCVAARNGMHAMRVQDQRRAKRNCTAPPARSCPVPARLIAATICGSAIFWAISRQAHS